jgi:adenylate kinase
MLNIIIFGPPGCGKGTQSSKITEKYNLVHISTGDIIRKEIKSSSEFGIQLKSIVEKGELVPYDLIIKILESALVKNKNSNGFIFDGFPRTIDQAVDLDNILTKDNTSISMVLSLTVEDDVVIERLLKRAQIEGRKDDTEDVIKNRLKIYKAETFPLIERYKEQGKYYEVEGCNSIDKIFECASDIIDKKYNQLKENS